MFGVLEEARFTFGLGDIRAAYTAAREALVRQRETAEATARRHFGLGEQDPVPDDDGGDESRSTADLLWEHVGELEWEADAAARVVRSAFLIALFHFWERNSNRWRGAQAYDHATTIALLRARHIEPRDDDLRILQLAANCLKHGPGKSCTELHKMAPQLFELETVRGLPPDLPSDETLSPTDDLLERLFRAVVISGPKAKKLGQPRR